MRNTKQRTSTYLLPVLYFPASQLTRVHLLPSLIYPLLHDAQMLALFVVQAVPVTSTPSVQEQVLATHDVIYEGLLA